MHSNATKQDGETGQGSDQTKLTDVGAVLELLYQLEAAPLVLDEEAIHHIQSLHDEVRAAAEKCEAFLAGGGAKKRFHVAVDAERDALADYGFESFGSFAAAAGVDNPLPPGSEPPAVPPVAHQTDHLSSALRDRVNELLGLSCATRDVAISAAKAALTRAASAEFVSAKIADLDPNSPTDNLDKLTSATDSTGEASDRPSILSEESNDMDEATNTVEGATSSFAPHDMLRMVAAIGATTPETEPTQPVEASVVETSSDEATVLAPASASVEALYAELATTTSMPASSTPTDLDSLFAPLNAVGARLVAAIEATRADAVKSLEAITAEGDRIRGVLEGELRHADEVRAETAQRREHAEQQATTLVDAAVREAERVKAEAMTEVAAVRDRLSRLSAEVLSVAADLER